MTAPIRTDEFMARRKKVLRALGKQIAVVFAGEQTDPLHGAFVCDKDFAYLTGLTDEPGAMLVLDPTQPVSSWRDTLVLRPLDPELEQWDGRRDPISGALKARLGFKRVVRSNRLGRVLRETLQRGKSLACLHAFADFDQPVGPDLSLYRQIAERVPGVAIDDSTNVLPALRSVKSTAEVRCIAGAINATMEGHRKLLSALEPGVEEHALQAELEHGFALGGGRGHAFRPIVGSGKNATVLHYVTNHDVAGDGELLLLDCGTTVNGYCSDITRCFPVSGKFSKRQREIYGIVLRALKAATTAVAPGVTMAQVDAVARKIIDAAGFGDNFMHGIGHHLGLDVHDSNPGGKLAPGNVVTIEPGIYLEDEGIGVRIEDDILVTKSGRRNLSSKIPREISDVEAFIREARRG
ncbi:MAG: Xaa-Pro peptidase family protein [Planctomycetota bacterium]